jgi:hypothetical protein
MAISAIYPAEIYKIQRDIRIHQILLLFVKTVALDINTLPVIANIKKMNDNATYTKIGIVVFQINRTVLTHKVVMEFKENTILLTQPCKLNTIGNRIKWYFTNH